MSYTLPLSMILILVAPFEPPPEGGGGTGGDGVPTGTVVTAVLETNSLAVVLVVNFAVVLVVTFTVELVVRLIL